MSKMADDDPWLLKEDGCLNVDTECKSIIYHANLNVLLITTGSAQVYVFDVNSGVILQRSSLSGERAGLSSSRIDPRGWFRPGTAVNGGCRLRSAPSPFPVAIAAVRPAMFAEYCAITPREVKVAHVSRVHERACGDTSSSSSRFPGTRYAAPKRQFPSFPLRDSEGRGDDLWSLHSTAALFTLSYEIFLVPLFRPARK